MGCLATLQSSDRNKGDSVDGEKFGGWVVNYPAAFDIRTVPYRLELSHDFESADRFEFSVGIAWFLGIVGPLAILKLVDGTVGLRVSEEEEVQGLDLSQHGEEGYYWEASA